MRNNKEKILILFEGVHIAYSPTVIQLYEELEKKSNVLIYAEDPKNFTNQKLEHKKVVYFQYKYGVVRYFLRIWFEMLRQVRSKSVTGYLKNNQGHYLEYFYRFRPLEKLIREQEFSRIISVDIKNLYFCTLLKVKSDFVSLELCANEKLLPLVDQNLINCVIIQSKERYEYLFKEKGHKVFYVQNAPVFKPLNKFSEKRGLVYNGTAWDAFGFFHCLDYITKFKDETLFVQGAVPAETKLLIEKNYPSIVAEGRLNISDKYLPNDEVVESISHFEIGLCFYNFEIESINNFNYKSGPSGKLFKYLAAGIPVVGNDIPGFKLIKEYNCGALVPNLDEDSIRSAISSIRSNYSVCSDNALNLAKTLSFDKMIKPYIDYIN